MEFQNFPEKKFSTNRFSEQGSYEWKITWADVRNVQKSPNFYPLGSENQWFLLCEEQCEDLSMQFHSLKKTDRFVTLEFFVHGERLSNPLSGCVCGCYTIGTISPMNPLKMDDFPRKHSIVKVVWSWGNMSCWDENLHQELLINLHSMLESGKFSDLMIEMEDGSKIPVHRAILSARSPVFCAMLENDMLESRTQCLKITDFCSETVKNMVNYLYTSETPEYSFDSTTDLLRVADKYDLSSLKSVCAETLSKCLSENNAIQLLLLADTYSVRYLKEKALEFVSKNQSHFADRGKLQLLLKQRPELLLDVTISNSKTDSTTILLH